MLAKVLRPCIYTGHDEHMGTTVATETVKATNLSCAVGTPSGSVLADGSFVFAVSVQLDWVYVKALRPDGRFVRRRYRHDKMVEVQA